jgi:hypothetical protein
MTTRDLDLEGRISIGRSRKGGTEEPITLELSERSVYQLQQLLESEAVKAQDYLTTRWFVLMAEDLRGAVDAANRRGRRAALDGQRMHRLPQKSADVCTPGNDGKNSS